MSSITVDVHSPAGKKVGKAELPAEYFDVQTNVPLIHQVVVAQLAAARQGTHATKTRGQVRGGGIKPWRQKGTGRARHGSRRSPIWTGGGTVHGPQPRDYSQRTPKKMIAAALRGALSDRARDGQIFVVSEVVSGETPSTKQALATLKQLAELKKKVLVVLDRFEEVAWLSLRNVPTIHVLAVDQINTYDVLVADSVVFTSAALAAFTNRGTEAVATESEADAEVDIPEAPVKKSGRAEEKVDAVAPEAKDYGKDSYRGSEPPAGFDIKGNEDSMKFHTPESPWYSRTIAEVWFNSAEAAEAAGFVNVMEGKEKK